MVVFSIIVSNAINCKHQALPDIYQTISAPHVFHRRPSLGRMNSLDDSSCILIVDKFRWEWHSFNCELGLVDQSHKCTSVCVYNYSLHHPYAWIVTAVVIKTKVTLFSSTLLLQACQDQVL
eukprot:c23373_g1_i1 orf=173-535(-)